MYLLNRGLSFKLTAICNIVNNIFIESLFSYRAVNYGLNGKTIPELFGSLLTLKGLFLGRLMCSVCLTCIAFKLT